MEVTVSTFLLIGNARRKINVRDKAASQQSAQSVPSQVCLGAVFISPGDHPYREQVNQQPELVDS